MKLSIIIATFNSERYLADTIDSLRHCTGQADCEVVFVDGGSRDHTEDLVQRCTLRKRFLSQDGRGLYNALNVGVREALGDWIAFLHSDDVWLRGPVIPGELSDVVWVGDVSFFRELGKTEYTRRLPWFPRPALRQFPFIFHPNALYPRTLLLEHPFDETMGRKADMEQIAAFAEKVQFRRMTSFEYGFRIHEGSTTVQGTTVESEAWIFWLWRVYVFSLFEDRRLARMLNFIRGRRLWKNAR